jgi:hypothetical protein
MHAAGDPFVRHWKKSSRSRSMSPKKVGSFIHKRSLLCSRLLLVSLDPFLECCFCRCPCAYKDFFKQYNIFPRFILQLCFRLTRHVPRNYRRILACLVIRHAVNTKCRAMLKTHFCFQTHRWHLVGKSCQGTPCQDVASAQSSSHLDMLSCYSNYELRGWLRICHPMRSTSTGGKPTQDRHGNDRSELLPARPYSSPNTRW